MKFSILDVGTKIIWFGIPYITPVFNSKLFYKLHACVNNEQLKQ